MSLFAAVLLVVSAASWAGLDLQRKFLADRLAPTTALALVAGLATPVFLAWALYEAPLSDWILDPAWAAPAFGSLALNVVANLLYFRSLQISQYSHTVPLLALTPLFASLVARGYLDERLTGRQVVGMTVVVGAAFLLQSGRRSPAGVLRAFFAERGAPLMAAVALFWAAATTLDKEAVRHSLPAFYAAFLNGGVALFAFTLLAAQRRTGELRRAATVVQPLAIGLVCSVIALGAQLIVIREVPVGLLETVKRGLGGFAAVAFGAWFFRERVTLWKVATIAAMTGGVALIAI